MACSRAKYYDQLPRVSRLYSFSVQIKGLLIKKISKDCCVITICWLCDVRLKLSYMVFFVCTNKNSGPNLLFWTSEKSLACNTFAVARDGVVFEFNLCS